MTKRTARAHRTQAKNGAGPALLHLVEPMLAGMTTTRQHLLAWVHAHGLAALDATRLGRRSTIVGVPPSAVPNFAKSLIVVARRGVSDAARRSIVSPGRAPAGDG